jgi:hypothetical protein
MHDVDVFQKALGLEELWEVVDESLDAEQRRPAGGLPGAWGAAGQGAGGAGVLGVHAAVRGAGEADAGRGSGRIDWRDRPARLAGAALLRRRCGRCAGPLPARAAGDRETSSHRGQGYVLVSADLDERRAVFAVGAEIRRRCRRSRCLWRPMAAERGRCGRSARTCRRRTWPGR